MKTALLTAILGLAAGAVGMAQTTQTARFEIPFAFQASGVQMEPGTYDVRRDGRLNSVSVTPLQGRMIYLPENDRSNKLMLGSPAVMAFHRYGDQYFLSRISFAGAQSQCVPKISKQEREVVWAKGASAEVILRRAD